MTQWEVVLVIIALVGLIGAIVKPIVSLTKSITTLNDTVASLKKDLTGFTAKNTEAHRRLWEHNVKQDETIFDHETRLTVMEKEK